MKKYLILIPFHAKIGDGCDYIEQTIKILGRNNSIYGIAQSDRYSLRDLPQFLQKKAHIITHMWNGTIIRPLFFIPGQRWKFIEKTNILLWAVAVWLYVSLRYSHTTKILWIFEPLDAPLWLRVCKGFISLYCCIDAQFDRGVNWANDERYVVRHCNGMSVISDMLLDIHSHMRRDLVKAPWGFAEDVFNKFRKTSRKIPDNVYTVGYVGAICYRLDFPFLTELVRSLPDVKFVFAGPVVTGLISGDATVWKLFADICSNKNVKYVGNFYKKDIPGLISSFSVGLIPYSTKYVFNLASFPLKLFEYFYFGIPVVSTKIREMRNFQRLVCCTSQAAEAVRFINDVVQNGWPDQFAREQKQIVRRHSWQRFVRACMDLIEHRTELPFRNIQKPIDDRHDNQNRMKNRT